VRHTFFVCIILFERKARMVLAIYALTLVISITSNLLLIPGFPPVGAGATCAITNLFFFLSIGRGKPDCA